MQPLPPLPKLSHLLQMYNVRATKQLGQNFLLNERLCSKDARVCAHAPSDTGSRAGARTC